MEINEAIKFLEKQIKNPKSGLPEEIFYFITRNTPMVNVDLLIKDDINRTLLSWRNDIPYGQGWHIPGGIVRFKEKLEERIQETAKKEIGTYVRFDPLPLKISEIILNQKNRAHFISFLYRCYVSDKFVPENKGLTIKSNGYLKWHETCPKNLIKVHEIYRKLIEGDKHGNK